jgi:hypothetical protein
LFLEQLNLLLTSCDLTRQHPCLRTPFRIQLAELRDRLLNDFATTSNRLNKTPVLVRLPILAACRVSQIHAVLALDIDRMVASTKQGGRSALHALFQITPFVAQSLTPNHTPKIGGIHLKLRKLG